MGQEVKSDVTMTVLRFSRGAAELDEDYDGEFE